MLVLDVVVIGRSRGWGWPSSIGRLGVGVSTIVVDSRARDSHHHWKLVDTEGKGSWLVIFVSITLDENNSAGRGGAYRAC